MARQGGSSNLGQGLMGVVAAIVLIAWFTSVRSGPTRVIEERQCISLYAAARTRADSAAVDATRPLGAAADSSARHTCGDMRMQGKLSPAR